MARPGVTPRGWGIEHQRAANLANASPDMLVALQESLDINIITMNTVESALTWPELPTLVMQKLRFIHKRAGEQANKARAAIAKAKGEA